MARKDEIEVIVDAQGNIRVETVGIKGKHCLDVMEVFQEIFGPVDEHELTSEYYEPDAERQAGISEREQSI